MQPEGRFCTAARQRPSSGWLYRNRPQNHQPPNTSPANGQKLRMLVAQSLQNLQTTVNQHGTFLLPVRLLLLSSRHKATRPKHWTTRLKLRTGAGYLEKGLRRPPALLQPIPPSHSRTRASNRRTTAGSDTAERADHKRVQRVRAAGNNNDDDLANRRRFADHRQLPTARDAVPVHRRWRILHWRRGTDLGLRVLTVEGGAGGLEPCGGCEGAEGGRQHRPQHVNTEGNPPDRHGRRRGRGAWCSIGFQGQPGFRFGGGGGQ